jgi:CheY-like chemotaxis protein
MKDNLVALVVDDSSSMRNYVASILRQEAYVGDVLEAGDGDDAILKLQSNRHKQIACIFLDVEMPGLETHEILAHLRNNPDTMDVPCVLLTAKHAYDAEKIATALRVDGFLCKPFKPVDVLRSWSKVFMLPDRRREQRKFPSKPCAVDLGFDNYNHYAAELLNISMTGCLIKTGILGIGAGHVYDVGSVIINPDTQDAVKLSGQIVRIQADKALNHTDKSVLIAFQFTTLDEDIQHWLKQYVRRLELN